LLALLWRYAQAVFPSGPGKPKKFYDPYEAAGWVMVLVKVVKAVHDAMKTNNVYPLL
jgi:hypothetical protein